MVLEACVENFQEALQAQKAGAGRIELCDNLAVGGTTPSYGTIAACNKYLSIPVIVMIRPRGGNFIYSAEELESMADDIRICREIGVAGIAIGVLTTGNEIDIPVLNELLRNRGNLEVTFHKAIDETAYIEKEVSRLKDTGVCRILTSGGQPTAMEGAGMINRMIKEAAGRLSVMPAGKVTASNINTLANLIPAREFHGRLIVGPLYSNNT
jgi:copper homeostasis protein